MTNESERIAEGVQRSHAELKRRDDYDGTITTICESIVTGEGIDIKMNHRIIMPLLGMEFTTEHAPTDIGTCHHCQEQVYILANAGPEKHQELMKRATERMELSPEEEQNDG